MTVPPVWTLRASVLQTPTHDRLEVLRDVVIEVSEGVISSIDPADGVTERADVVLGPDRVLVPGLIYLHVHAPQWPQLGTGLDLPLDEWLFEYTFPLEAKCEDLAYATGVWEQLVPALLANGTTTAVYYSSIHEPATTALAEACLRHGQRAWVGRVAMDHPTGTPPWYRDESADEAMSASRRSIEQIRALDGGRGLVRPIVTPRFVPACSDELLAGLGRLAAETGTLVQTHCSENDWEHQYVLDRCGQSDTSALDGFGLLRPSTVLAHAPHVGSDDLDRIASAGAGIAHCPLSNVYFGNAVFPARHAIDRDVAVGLGTDIAGGPSPSVFATAAHAANSSRMLDDGVDPDSSSADRGRPGSRIDAVTAFWMATVGGASVLGEPLGLIEVGRRFDAVAVSTDRHLGWGELDNDAGLFEKLVRLTTAADVGPVWVEGVRVSG